MVEIKAVTAERVIRANRDFYAEQAEIYESEEHCANDPAARELLATVLSRALVLCSDRQNPAVLDACGGSGNASEILADLGYRTVLVDVSPQMLSIWRAKASARGFSEPEAIESDIDAFLEHDDRLWDLIVFSSAMHHLENYAETASKAVSALAPGGVLVTAFDPTAVQGRILKLLRRLDWVVAGAFRHPVSFMQKVLEKAIGSLGRLRGSPADLSTGALAERYALIGVDEDRLITAITAAGGEVLVHERYSHSRLFATELAFRLLRTPSSFHLIARKSSNDERN